MSSRRITSRRVAGGEVGVIRRREPRRVASESVWDRLDLGDTAATGWMRAGLCAQTDPGAFYPAMGQPSAPAKRVCTECPVASDCLAYALEHNERFGVWGGLSERERRPLVRALRATAMADDAAAGTGGDRAVAAKRVA